MAKTRRRQGSVQKEGDFSTLPEDLLSITFSSVAFREVGNELEVSYKLLVPPCEEWKTAVVVHSSESMRHLFGKTLTGDIPLSLQERYFKQNLAFQEQRDGKTVLLYKPEAYDEALGKGYLQWTSNDMEPKARSILEFLAKRVDKRKTCNLMHVGCGGTDGWCDLGAIALDDCSKTSAQPPDGTFGNTSTLLPLLRFLTDHFAVSQRTLVVVLTDGHFSDLVDVKDYSEILAPLVRTGQKKFQCFQILGMGKDVHQQAMTELKGMKTGEESELWNYRHLDDLGDMRQILKGVLSPEMIVAPSAKIFDAAGNTVKTFENGFPVQGTFRMPVDSTSFSLQIPPSQDLISQSLLLPFHKELVI